MFTKHLSAFKLLIVVFTPVICSSFIFIPPTFAGNPGSVSTGKGSPTQQGKGSPTRRDTSNKPKCTHPAQQIDCRP